MIESRYVPVPVTLEPRESINSKFHASNPDSCLIWFSLDQGVLRVDLLDGSDIRGVDRGGTYAEKSQASSSQTNT